MQSSKDIKLQFYCTNTLLIREMFYTYKNSKKPLYLRVAESPTRNIVCSFDITKQEAAKKIASYIKENFRRDGTWKVLKKCLEQTPRIVNLRITSSL